MRYFLLDANVVVPQYVDEGPELDRRVHHLFATRSSGEAFLFVPNICVPEVLKAFAKKCFQDRLFGDSAAEARSAFENLRREFLNDIVGSRVLYSFELSRRHILLTDAVYESAASRSFRKGSQPNAVDLMIVAMGMDLVSYLGREDFTVVTAERPLFDLCSADPERLPPVFHLGERDLPGGWRR